MGRDLAYADLVGGGDAPGPEILAEPWGFEEAEKRERIWRYHEDVVCGRRIGFVPRETVLQPPPGSRRKPKRRLDVVKERDRLARLQVFLDSAFGDPR